MHSLRARLSLTHILVALVAVVVVAGLASFLIQRGFDNLADQQARIDAEDIADRLVDYYDRRGTWRGVELFLRRRFPLLQANSPLQRRRMQLVDQSGAVVFDSSQIRASRQLVPLITGVRAPILVNGVEVGSVLASNARDELTGAERDFLARMRFSMIVGSLAAGGVALVAGLISAAQVTNPLRSLTAAARRLADGERHEPLSAPTDRELADLANAFNLMASELERQEQLRRHQVADIAHELRTPLSVLRLQLESLEDGVEQPTPTLLASLTEEVGLLNRLVDDLRLLSLADAGQLTLQIEALDVADVLASIATRSATRARQLGIALQVVPTQGLMVAADPQRLAQILGNVVENAMRYTSRGGSITISATESLGVIAPQQAIKGQTGKPIRRKSMPARDSQLISFSVTDTGPGIPEEEQTRLFERFWRADRARTRETGGSGLGLAIVQRLVELQGGQVSVTSQVGQGTTVTVRLPAVR